MDTQERDGSGKFIARATPIGLPSPAFVPDIDLMISSCAVQWRVTRTAKPHRCECCHGDIPAKTLAYCHERRGRWGKEPRHVYTYVHTECFERITKRVLDEIFRKPAVAAEDDHLPKLTAFNHDPFEGAGKQDDHPMVAAGTRNTVADIERKAVELHDHMVATGKGDRGVESKSRRPFDRLSDRQLWWCIAAAFAAMALFSTFATFIRPAVLWLWHLWGWV